MWYSQLNPQCKELWNGWSLNTEKKDAFSNKPRLGGLDVLTARYLETGDPKYAEAVKTALPAARSMTLTQHVLGGLRSWCYAVWVFETPAGAAVGGK
jgi:predicted branched-subunit amino acid permease